MREREGKEVFIGKRMEKQQWKRERQNEISMKKRERKNERSQPKREILQTNEKMYSYDAEALFSLSADP